MRGRLVEVWHPDSPGQRIIVWRPWWRRKLKLFASLGEALRSSRYDQRSRTGVISAIDIHKLMDPDR